ncbi:anhydro-N-acetylmuramic acid kinase [Streptomyces sp. NBC_01465]|uniref:anhydro-N-acetylmuramic acid kinase n=1 Tax=Streptomyces sp. NBC_01465 TaxID=2903878 RepID=UPI002E2FE01E|nr:anhydro-N-acetylmuramic acid kinase [Streptomyces sp. NBC_01465]
MKILGLSSGTSHDAIDAAVVELALDGGTLVGHLVHMSQHPYPHALRAEILAALPPHEVSLATVCRLDTLIGQSFADAAAASVAAAGPVDLVCSHGQTLYHWVDEGTVRGTLQLGQPAWIAERLGVPVVSDVRTADVAAGGQGAPLVSLLDTLLLAGLPGPAGALNLGGIANVTVVGAGSGAPFAFDTGPANALMDAAALAATGIPYDEDGRLAAAGEIDEELLTALLAEPYYRREPPKTTGKELFHAGYLAGHLAARPALAAEDLLATLAELTARTVADAVRDCGLRTLVVSGGGAENPVLTGRIGALLPGVEVVRSDALGLPSAAKEAAAFALLGWFTAHGLPGTLPSCTGAEGGRVLGRITPGGGPLRLPEPLAEAPAAVRFSC